MAAMASRMDESSPPCRASGVLIAAFVLLGIQLRGSEANGSLIRKERNIRERALPEIIFFRGICGISTDLVEGEKRRKEFGCGKLIVSLFIS